MADTGLSGSPGARPTRPCAGDGSPNPATDPSADPLLPESPTPGLVLVPSLLCSIPLGPPPAPGPLPGPSGWCIRGSLSPGGALSPPPSSDPPHVSLSDKYNDFIEANRIEDASERMRTLRKLVGRRGERWGGGHSPGAPRFGCWCGWERCGGGEQRGDPVPPRRSATCQVTTTRRSSSWWVT